MRRLILLVLVLTLLPRALAAEEAVIGRLDRAPRSYLEETPYLTQCQLGSVLADSVRAASGCQIALINAGDLQNDLNDGPVTRAELRRVCREPLPVGIAELTPARLWAVLEHSVSRAVTDPETEQIRMDASAFGGFCQISGFRFQYDITAPAGERILSVALEDGTVLEKEDDASLLTAAATEEMLSGGWGYEPAASQPAGFDLETALAGYVAAHTALPEEGPDRITMIGARQNTVAGAIPAEVLPVGSGALILLAAVSGLRMKKTGKGNDIYGLLYSR